MDTAEKVYRAMAWMDALPEANRRRAVKELLEHAFASEWIDLPDELDVGDLIEEGCSMSDATAPYFTTCGDPLDYDFEKEER